MKFESCLLPQVFQWVQFNFEQRHAIQMAYQCYSRSHGAQQLTDRDIAELEKPGGASTIMASDQEIDSCFGVWAGVYPVLILLALVPSLLKRYQDNDIDLRIFRDTLNDIPLWMDNYKRKTGLMGLAEYEWLSNYLRFNLFRLGRLEYIYCPSRVPAYVFRHFESGADCYLMQEGMPVAQNGELAREGEESFVTDWEENSREVIGYETLPNGTVAKQRRTLSLTQWECRLRPGDPVLDVHIPEGSPMDRGEILDSLAYAPVFFKKKLRKTDMRAFTCGSWMMSPSLHQIIPGSRLAAFQELFRCVPYTIRDTQVFERVFGKHMDCWEDMPCENRLQRGIRDWYLQGKNCRQMQGVILLNKV